MKLAFITDPLASLKIAKDSTYAMMREAARRGHELYALQQEDLVWRDNTVRALARRLYLTADAASWYRTEAAADLALKDYDAVLMRKDPPFDMEYVYSTYLLEFAQREGARIYNDPRAVRDNNEKLGIARFAHYTAPTVVARNASAFHQFLQSQHDIILKPLDGMGGTSVFRVRRDDPNLNVIIETVTDFGRRTTMAQRYIPEIVEGDKRILLIAGKPVPYALARIPKPGETRANLAAGGTGIARELTARDREIAEALAPQLHALGLFLVGLDVIGDYLTEVNVTSPTCFQEITAQTGFDVAAMMLDELEHALVNL